MTLIEGRRDGRVLVNGAVLALPILESLERRHHDRFKWGFLSSGAAELARAILVTVYPGDRLVRLPVCYQRFKVDVVAKLAPTGFRLDEATIHPWYGEFRRAHPGLVVLYGSSRHARA